MDSTEADERTFLGLMAFIYLLHEIPQKAAVIYEALMAIAPDDITAAKGLAWARLEDGDAAGSLKVLDGIVGPGEPGAVVHLLRARALARLDRLDDARVAMQAFLVLRTKEVQPL